MKRIARSKEERPLLKASSGGEGESRRYYDSDACSVGARSPLNRVIKELLSFRKPFYERAASIKIDTSKLDIDSVVERIINRLSDESFNL